MSAGELLGFASRGALLHVSDLAVAERDHYWIALRRHSVGTRPVRGTDDVVFSDLSKREVVDLPTAARLQDLTGLVRSPSRGGVFPPEMAVRDAAPLSVLCEERGERFGITVTQRLGCSAKLIDHGRSMAQTDEEDEPPFLGLLQVEAVRRICYLLRPQTFVRLTLFREIDPLGLCGFGHSRPTMVG